MISVNIQYTDSLGPEADMPALLGKVAAAIGGADGLAGELVRAGALPVTEFVVAEHAWISVSVTVKAPAERLSAAKAIFPVLADLVERHLSDLFPRRSLDLTLDLDVLGREGLIERRHARPASGDGV
jgi:5-carboxymethyl-2-hydroxymuconate isomerase